MVGNHHKGTVSRVAAVGRLRVTVLEWLTSKDSDPGCPHWRDKGELWSQPSVVRQFRSFWEAQLWSCWKEQLWVSPTTCPKVSAHQRPLGVSSQKTKGNKRKTQWDELSPESLKKKGNNTGWREVGAISVAWKKRPVGSWKYSQCTSPEQKWDCSMRAGGGVEPCPTDAVPFDQFSLNTHSTTLIFFFFSFSFLLPMPFIKESLWETCWDFPRLISVLPTIKSATSR